MIAFMLLTFIVLSSMALGALGYSAVMEARHDCLPHNPRDCDPMSVVEK